MLAFPSMLIGAAEQANIRVPPDPDNFSRDDFPHFYVFCVMQLGRTMDPGEHWDNAKVIASLTIDELKTMTVGQLEERGFKIKRGA